MKEYLLLIARKLGFDKSIAYSSGGSIVGAITGILILFFIGLFLSEEEQGFYFTFNSIIAIQVFFDLGLTGIMTQYVAHEHAHLHWAENQVDLIGEEKYASRLSSLLKFCVKWYGAISVLFFITLNIVGFVFFEKYDNEREIEWQIPWLLLCAGASANLFLAPIMAFVTGIDKVKEVMKIRFYKNLIIPLVTCLGLLLGFKLYVLGIASIATAVYNYSQISFTQLGEILRSVWKTKITEKVSYMKEIFPYQWKIALSWVSGYFIFQLFNPVLFATEGPAVAGQMGMTLQILNAINALTMSWMNTKVPLFSRLIELKDYYQLDTIFMKTLKQVGVVSIFLLSIFFFGVVLIHVTDFQIGNIKLYNRILHEGPLLLMIVALLANMVVSSVATYLRCHKQEPLLIQSITMGVLTMLSTFLMGNAYGLYGITIGYFLLCTLVSLPWGICLFKKYKAIWHR